MSLDRREFLAGTGAAAGSLMLASAAMSIIGFDNPGAEWRHWEARIGVAKFLRG
jgi:hypothetical protein